MTHRSEDLQLFADTAFVAFDRFVRNQDGRRSILQIFEALENIREEREGPNGRLPACDFLSEAISEGSTDPVLRRMIERFEPIEHKLDWRRRTSYDATASDNFVDGHANAMIFGPGGLEAREDVWLGVTLMAPNVRYPDHQHAPEEVYLALSDGEFRQGDGEWFSPGIGGSFYNLPNIKHAMRSMDKPLFAFWALLP